MLGAIHCGDDGGAGGAGGSEPLTASQARFELGTELPRFLDVPFPSDVYLEPDGTVVDRLPGLEVMVPTAWESVETALGGVPGFGRVSGVLFRIDRAGTVGEDGEPEPADVDPSAIPARPIDCMDELSGVLLVDLDAGEGEPSLVPCRAGYQDDRPRGSKTRPVLVVAPDRGVVLAEGRRYAAVLTSRLTADMAVPVTASPDFVRIRDGARATDHEQLYGEAIDAVAAKVPFLADKTKIIAVSPFTTQATTDELVELRERVGTLPPPALEWDEASVAPMYPGFFTKEPTAGATATLDEWLGAPAKLPDGTDDPAGDQATGRGHDALLAVATGVFQTHNFLRQRPGSYADPEHATFARDASGKVTLDPDRPTAPVWVTIAIPDAPMPASGYPVVVLQHGLQGDRSFILTMANTFAKRGWATVAIEGVTFGARSDEPAFQADLLSRFSWSNDAGAYAGPDGLVDVNANALDFLGDLVSFGATRDQLRQTALDLGTLAELLNDPALDLGPLATLSPGLKLDGARLGYVGDSYGSVVGGLVAAVDPRYRAMVLNVAGGGILFELVSNGPLLSSIVGPLAGLTFGITNDRLNWKHPLGSLLQPVLDAGDPLTFADRFVKRPVTVTATDTPKSIVLIEVLWDELIANEGTEALAKAGGVPLAAPNVGPHSDVALEEVQPVDGVVRGAPSPDHTVVVVQASPATHGVNLYDARGTRRFEPPFVREGDPGFVALETPFEIDQPYLGLQTMVVGFIGTAFDDEVPAVADFPTPVLDFDGDGVPDTSDLEPFDPAKP
jgi:hypothetical protein